MERPMETPRSKPVERPKTRTAERARSSFGISAFGVAGFLIVSVLMVFVLLAYIQRTELSSEAVTLQNQLDVLSETETKLLISYERAFDINEIEEYATSELGMVKPSADQISTVTTSITDKAVVLDSGRESQNIFTAITSFLSSLVEYFK
jgi:cell division protein FtsB